MSNKNHWKDAYKKTETSQLGWYEETPQPSIDLIDKINPPKDVKILNVGAGSSTLIDYLIDEGFTNVIVNDISSVAIDELKERLGEKQNEATYILDDLTSPKDLLHMEPIDIWHDRAVLHFFLKEDEKDTYFNLLKSKVKSKGHVIIAEFSEKGAKKCSGLELCRYSEKMISQRLGEEFTLIESFNFTFINPRGDERPYIYTLYQRK